MISLLLSVAGWLFAIGLAGFVLVKLALLAAILALMGAWRRPKGGRP